MIWIYAVRNVVRKPMKSLLLAALSALLLIAAAQFALAYETYDRLYNDVQLKCTLLGGDVPYSLVNRIADSGFVRSRYVAQTLPIRYTRPGAPEGMLHMTSDVMQEKLFADGTLAVQYGEGYDAARFYGDEPLCLASAAMMEQYGLSCGDTVQVARAGFMVGSFDGQAFTIAGFFGTPDGQAYTNDLMISYRAAGKHLMGVFPTDNVLHATVAEFVLDDNNRAGEFTAYLDRALKQSAFDSGYFLNTHEIKPIEENYELLRALYPVLIAVLCTIGGGASVFAVLQARHEAAVLRVLGRKRAWTAVALALEPVLLCAAGMAAGFLALMCIHSGLLFAAAGRLALSAEIYGAAYAAITCAAAWAATSGKVLDLLRAKE